MKIAFVVRSTLYSAPGGNTIQVVQTARHLRQLDVDVEICFTHKEIHYSRYDLFHFFNITRPADILYHTGQLNTPFVLSPILVDYSEYDKHHRGGLAGFVFRLFPADTNEYIKTVSRAIKGTDSFSSWSYLWKGHYKSVTGILKRASALLPNSEMEYQALVNIYGVRKPYTIVPNGVDPLLFRRDDSVQRNNKLIICAARIEGIKNQLGLIKAVNNSVYTLVLIGSPAPNQTGYYRRCRKIAAANIHFTGRLSQEELLAYYRKAKVHVFPSWFETCGLSSLEAAATGCNLVITGKGYTREYFGEEAFYCDPGDPETILRAIEKAAANDFSERLERKIRHEYNWQRAAAITLETYKKIISV